MKASDLQTASEDLSLAIEIDGKGQNSNYNYLLLRCYLLQKRWDEAACFVDKHVCEEHLEGSSDRIEKVQDW